MTDENPMLAFETHDGLPRPRWDEFVERLMSLAPHAREAASWSAAKEWLTTLARAVSRDATVFVTRRVLLLGSPTAEPLAVFAERTLDHIDRLLDRISSLEWCGPHVVIVFDSRKRYYDYVSYFDSRSGPQASSAGTFITRGYHHVVVGPGNDSSRRCTISHELTHEYFSDRDLPFWLDEGLAQLVEHHAVGVPFFLNREHQREHLAHWSATGLEPFWSGEAFSMPESQGLAYQLALVLVRSIISDASKRAAEFVRQAHYRDAGEGAAQQVLGRSLADYVGAFLGPGDWAP